MWTLGEEHLESERLAYRGKLWEVGQCLLSVKINMADVAAVQSSLVKVCILREKLRSTYTGLGGVLLEEVTL